MHLFFLTTSTSKARLNIFNLLKFVLGVYKKKKRILNPLNHCQLIQIFHPIKNNQDFGAQKVSFHKENQFFSSITQDKFMKIHIAILF